MDFKDEEIVELFFNVMKLNRRFSEIRYGNMSLFQGQYHCLFVLESVGTVNQRDLAKILQIRPTSVSEILLKLEKKGMIQRIPSETDRRVSLVSLTEEGIRQAQISRKERARAHREMLSELTQEEKEQFHTALKKIRNYYISMEEKENESSTDTDK